MDLGFEWLADGGGGGRGKRLINVAEFKEYLR
jgi:hypothetical protein